MEMIPDLDRYWAKAKLACAGASDWHPFGYHSLDSAAVAAALIDRSRPIRRAFGSALDIYSVDDTARLPAWALLVVALHDLGKLRNLGRNGLCSKRFPCLDMKVGVSRYQ